jgi:hypothetical protein
MLRPLTIIGFALLVIFSGPTACNRNNQKTDIPDIEALYSDIDYLDSLTRSDQIDSMGKINDHLTVTILTYTNRAQSPEDKVILDSLIRINSVTGDFLRYCSDTRTNLELLDQDTRTMQNQYRSGKIKIAAYVSTLIEEEQMLIDISNQLSSKTNIALLYLKNQSLLINKLNPLPVPGD